MVISPDKNYGFEGVILKRIEQVKQRLYQADSRPFGPGEIRDLANILQALLDMAVELSDELE